MLLRPKLYSSPAATPQQTLSPVAARDGIFHTTAAYPQLQPQPDTDGMQSTLHYIQSTMQPQPGPRSLFGLLQFPFASKVAEISPCLKELPA